MLNMLIIALLVVIALMAVGLFLLVTRFIV